MKKLTLKEELIGFTKGMDYEVVQDEMNLVVVKDDNGKERAFNKVEGENDFKNFFTSSK